MPFASRERTESSPPGSCDAEDDPSTPRIAAATLRPVRRSDAARMHALACDSETLEANSCYAYLLLCEHFVETCLVAEAGERLAGFVVAYRPPTRPEALFVWQIGVASWARRRGMGLKLLEELRRQPACCDARFLEATVAPHNAASQRLFAAAASAWRAPLRIEPGFHAADFGAAAHSDEPLTRIGPLF